MSYYHLFCGGIIGIQQGKLSVTSLSLFDNISQWKYWFGEELRKYIMCGCWNYMSVLVTFCETRLRDKMCLRAQGFLNQFGYSLYNIYGGKSRNTQIKQDFG